jgi:single-stranded-DNA-specific exonuclease
METAVNRLVQAFKAQEKVYIYADFDLDGTSGLALLHSALTDFGFNNLGFYQPKRLTEGYGFHVEAVEDIAKNGADLIVTVDVGIGAISAAQRAKALGVDLIITDHHLPKDEIPESLAVVNPNKGTCPSGLGHLSGTGVAFFLAIALKRSLEKSGIDLSKIDMKSYLDVFVIGTITDMVPLVKDNRPLVKHGLFQITKSKRHGLRALMAELGLAEKKPLSSSDIGMLLAPKLNALSRLEADVMPIDVLMHESSKDGDEAKELIKRVLALNTERKEEQKRAEAAALFEAEEQADRGYIFVHSKDFHKGVIGLVAIKLAQRFGVPAFVGSESADGTITGSSRVPDSSSFHLVEILGTAHETLIQFGGHKEAAGFKLKKENALLFDAALGLGVSRFSKENLVKTYDMEIGIDQVDSELMSWLDRLEPFGKGFSYPVLRVSGCEIQELKVLNGGHLRVLLRGKRQLITGIYFNPPEGLNINVGAKVELLGELQTNEFRGRRSLQLILRDIRLVSSEA